MEKSHHPPVRPQQALTLNTFIVFCILCLKSLGCKPRNTGVCIFQLLHFSKPLPIFFLRNTVFRYKLDGRQKPTCALCVIYCISISIYTVYIYIYSILIHDTGITVANNCTFFAREPRVNTIAKYIIQNDIQPKEGVRFQRLSHAEWDAVHNKEKMVTTIIIPSLERAMMGGREQERAEGDGVGV